MPLFLAKRATELREIMDDLHCDRTLLYKTYDHFKIINQLLSGWHGLYRRYIKPLAQSESRKLRLLDIGFGGGDIPMGIAKWAQRDGIELEITAIEIDPRALEYVKKLPPLENVNFQNLSTKDLIAQQQTFDLVICTHVLHHLSEEEIKEILADAEQLATHLVLFNDLERSDIAYGLYGLIAKPLFPGSYLYIDGLRSIRRSYHHQELKALLPTSWIVKPVFPFRLLLVQHKKH
jgi:2-polyprenyl-3-methyl-5-hydroxy-6-metoxy-1,4-benzoquinol methylase